MTASDSGEAKHWDASRSRTSALRKSAGAALVLVILCAPSIWMMRAVPPLWKDTDAYLQVTAPPNSVTILLYAPLYCFSARVPLYVGYAYDRLRAGAGVPSPGFFNEPTLTDAGVWLLLLAQHAGLWLSSYYLLASATRVLLLRVMLAAIWALNPLLYIFAHTVASESLSAILLLLIAAVGLRIIRRPRRSSRWIVFGVLLAMSMLTRHINGVVAALLPLAFGLSALLRRDRMRRQVRYVGLAIVVALAGILLADGAFGLASRAAGIHYHRRIGFSFLFRLNFFAGLAPAERERVLDCAAAHARSPLVRYELDALRATPDREPFNAMALLARTYDRLPPDVAQSLDKTDEVLNETARAFLVAPSMPYLRAVAADVARAQHTIVPDIVAQLLRCTTAYFDDPTKMPQCSGLTTFRATDPHRFLSDVYKRRYFAVWKRCTYLRVLIAALAALLFSIRLRSRVTGYAASLLVVAFLSLLGNSVLNEFQPRYTLPMWELTFVALTILLPGVVTKLRRMRAWR